MLLDVAALYAGFIQDLMIVQVENGVAVVRRLVGIGAVERGELDIAACDGLDPGRYPIGLVFAEPGQSHGERMALVVGSCNETQDRLAAHHGLGIDGVHVQAAHHLPAEARRGRFRQGG